VEWDDWGIDDRQRAEFESHVASCSQALARTRPETDDLADDIAQEMYSKLFDLLANHPHKVPKAEPHRTKYLKTAMRNAGCDCVSRLYSDAPYSGRRKDVSRVDPLDP
jgi:hypothetical protein